jgi:hypothetical protein
MKEKLSDSRHTAGDSKPGDEGLFDINTEGRPTFQRSLTLYLALQCSVYLINTLSAVTQGFDLHSHMHVRICFALVSFVFCFCSRLCVFLLVCHLIICITVS